MSEMRVLIACERDGFTSLAVARFSRTLANGQSNTPDLNLLITSQPALLAIAWVASMSRTTHNRLDVECTISLKVESTPPASTSIISAFTLRYYRTSRFSQSASEGRITSAEG